VLLAGGVGPLLHALDQLRVERVGEVADDDADQVRAPLDEVPRRGQSGGRTVRRAGDRVVSAPVREHDVFAEDPKRPGAVADVAEAPPLRMPDAGVPLSPGALAGLQRSAGNAAVARLLARDPTTAPAGVYNPLQGGYDDARKARDAFVAAGKKGPQTYNPSTRNSENYYGGFDVEYDPGKDELLVTLKGGVLFLAGIVLDSAGRAQPAETSAQTAAAAAAINAMPAAGRAAAVLQWQWSTAGGPDANDEQDFLDGFKSSVESAWSKKHPFHVTKEHWQDVGAETTMKVEINKVAAAGGKGATQHMLVNAHKVPKNFVGGAADVSRPTGKTGSAFDNVMNVTSEDATPRHDDLLHRDVAFQPGKGLLTPGSVGTVWRLAKDMPNPKAGATIETAGITASVQGKDAAQRKDRFEAVLDHFKQGGGVDPGRVKFEDGGEGDAGRLTIGDGRTQTVVAHESGHMFGLDDEYTGAGAYAPGKSVEHTNLAAAAGEAGAMHASSDSIMSEGSKVRPQHYVTFLDALKVVSGIAEWGYGAKEVVKAPSAAGDFPVPAAPAANGTAVA
jgi:hypothetical protein